MPRFILVLLVGVAAITPQILPTIAHAGTHRVRGQIINRQGTIRGTTSNCSCDERWYTLGARAGTIKVSVKLEACSSSMSGFCSIHMGLVQGIDTKASKDLICWHPHGPCGQSGVTQYKAHRSGIFYLHIRGKGSDAIAYKMRIQAPIYRLHCRKYC